MIRLKNVLFFDNPIIVKPINFNCKYATRITTNKSGYYFFGIRPNIKMKESSSFEEIWKNMANQIKASMVVLDQDDNVIVENNSLLSEWVTVYLLNKKKISIVCSINDLDWKLIFLIKTKPIKFITP